MGRVLLWAVLGLILGGALAFGLGLFWLTDINTDQREGAAAMGVKAEARYRQLFTADEMGRKWTELYEELLEEKSLSYA